MTFADEFRAAAADPYAVCRSYKEDKQTKIIGYFCSYAPEEIILAAGFHPARLFGSSGEISHADAHLQSYCCSLVRGALEEALTGKLDFLDGTVFPNTCDSIQRLSDIWRLNTNYPFFADVILPVKLNTESARKYMADVIGKFRKDLEKGFGIDITDEAINAAIRVSNTIKKSLKRIYELRSKNPALISGTDIYAIVKASMIMDRNDLAEKLPQTVGALENENSSAVPEDKKRFILVGSVCGHADVHRLIEESGGVAVWDDMCTGTRYFEGMIVENTDNPISAIAKRYLERPICPAKHASVNARGEYVVKIAKAHKAHGVIFPYLKFCDPHAFDYPYIKDHLDRAKIPSILMEMEDGLPSEGQWLTRLETFIQMF